MSGGGSGDDTLRISTVPYDAEGNKIEVEEQTVERIVPNVAPVKFTNGQQANRGIRSEIVLGMTVNEVAQGIRKLCKDCKFFDNKAMSSLIANAERSGDISKRQAINDMRAQLLTTQNAQLSAMHSDPDDELDVEHALRAMGICAALGEHFQDLFIVHPMGCCPEMVGDIPVVTPTAPQGFFQAADRATKKAQLKAYDKLLGAASGKK